MLGELQSCIYSQGIIYRVCHMLAYPSPLLQLYILSRVSGNSVSRRVRMPLRKEERLEQTSNSLPSKSEEDCDKL